MLDGQVELINWRRPKTLLLPGPVPGQEKWQAPIGKLYKLHGRLKFLANPLFLQSWLGGKMCYIHLHLAIIIVYSSTTAIGLTLYLIHYCTIDAKLN